MHTQINLHARRQSKILNSCKRIHNFDRHIREVKRRMTISEEDKKKIEQYVEIETSILEAVKGIGLEKTDELYIAEQVSNDIRAERRNNRPGFRQNRRYEGGFGGRKDFPPRLRDPDAPITTGQMNKLIRDCHCKEEDVKGLTWGEASALIDKKLRRES